MKKNNLNNMNGPTRYLIKKELEFLKKAFERKDYKYTAYKADILNGIVTGLMYQNIINSYTYHMLSGIISSIDGYGKIKISLVKRFTKIS